MFYEIYESDGREYVSIRIKAQPAASKNEFCGLYGDDSIKIRIKAAASCSGGSCQQRASEVLIQELQSI